MRILLVQPPLDPATSKLSAIGLAEPLGLEYLAAAAHDHEVMILDLRVEGTLAGAVEAFAPEVVGVTAVTASLRTALEILHEAKQINPSIHTVIGGVHPTLRPNDCQVPHVDVIVRGEGEEALAEVAAKLQERATPLVIDGTVTRDSGGWCTHRERVLPPLDGYPEPARHLTEHLRPAYFRLGMGRTVSTLSSRGCSRRCSFCSVWRVHQGRYRKRSPELIVDELAARSETSIDFVDDDSFGDLRQMEALRTLIEQRLPDRSFRFCVRSDAVAKAPEVFERWAAVGLRFVLIGLEAFSDEELKALNKRSTVHHNQVALDVLRQAKIGTIGYIIVRPDYDCDDFKRLGDIVERLEIAQPIFGSLTPFPGTTLFDEVKGDLTTRNWDHFDGFHAVLPTRLPASEYYHELANLYRRCCTAPGAMEGLPWYEQLARSIEEIEP